MHEKPSVETDLPDRSIIHPARQKQQGHPQQARAEAVESLGFVSLLRKCLVEFIRLMERGVNAPTMNVNH